MPTSSAGETTSVRVPSEVRRQLYAATGVKFSTFVRIVASAVVEYYRAERREREGVEQTAEAKDAIEQATKDILQGLKAL